MLACNDDPCFHRHRALADGYQGYAVAACAPGWHNTLHAWRRLHLLQASAKGGVLPDVYRQARAASCPCGAAIRAHCITLVGMWHSIHRQPSAHRGVIVAVMLFHARRRCGAAGMATPACRQQHHVCRMRRDRYALRRRRRVTTSMLAMF